MNILVDRKNDGSRELMVGTRWNVMDPLGRLEKEHKHDPRYRFRKIPALDENDESNFQYEYGGSLRNITETCVKSWILMNGGRSSCKNRLFVKDCFSLKMT